MITRIVSNVKVGCDAQLSQRTLVVGPNEVGKSTIVNALELALSGRASDVAGRAEVGSQADLWSLAPEGAEEIVAEATTGAAPARFSMAAGKRPVRTGPLVSLPLREVREAILSTGEGGRKWLLSKMPVTASWRKSLVGDATKLSSLPDELSAAIESARGHARAARAESNALLDTVRRGDVARMPIARETIAAAEARLATAEAARDTLRAQGAPAAPAISSLAQLVVQLQDAHIAQQGQKCAVCGSAVELSVVAARRQRVQATLDAHVEVTAEITRYQAALNEAEFEANAAKAELVRLKSMAEAVTVASAASAERQTARAKQLDREADDWLRIAEALGARLTEDVEQVRIAFEQRVQRFLPKTDHFGVELQPFRLGLRSGNTLRTALSGAQWARVTIAVALAITPEGTPALAMPEERAWDPVTLAHVLDAWRDAPIQIVMTSTIDPARLPEGWSVYRVGAAKDAQEQPSPPPRASAEPGYCSACNAVVAHGECEHGVAAPTAVADKPPIDIFA